MIVRNLNTTKMDRAIGVRFSGHAHSLIWKPTVHMSVGSVFSTFRVGFHMPLKDAKKLIKELAKAIQQAGG